MILKYADTLRSGLLRFQWLEYYEEISLSVNLQFQARYVGDIPVISGMTFKLNSDIVASGMSNSTKNKLEMALIIFLQKEMEKKNVTILNVQITDQVVKTGHQVSNDRYLQRDNDDATSGRPVSTIDISTNIAGQYRPPPDIDFTAVVEDAIDANPQELEQSIKRSDTYFDIYQSIETEPITTGESNSELAVSPQMDSSASTTTILIAILVGTLGAFVLFVCGTYYWKKRERKRQKFSGASFVHESLVLQEQRERKGLFGFLGKSGKSMMDAYVTADVTWADATPAGDDASHVKYDKPTSFYDKEKSVPYKDEPYSAAQEESIAEKFNDEDAHGYSSSHLDKHQAVPYRDDPYGADQDESIAETFNNAGAYGFNEHSSYHERDPC